MSKIGTILTQNVNRIVQQELTKINNNRSALNATPVARHVRTGRRQTVFPVHQAITFCRISAMIHVLQGILMTKKQIHVRSVKKRVKNAQGL